MARSYSAQDIIANWHTLDFSKGWGADTFLLIEPNEEIKTATYGADSQVVYNKNPNRGAKISLTLMQGSELNRQIAAVAAGEALLGSPIIISNFVVVDKTSNTNHFVALNASLTEVSGHEWSKEVGEQTWVWMCETYIETDDPNSVLQNLDNYLRF